MIFRSLLNTLSNSSNGNDAWMAEREQRQSPASVQKSPVSPKKSPKKQAVCEFKSCTVRSEYSSVCSQLH